MPTTIRGQYFYLYLFLDVFSRKIVGWQVYAEESSVLASEVLKDLCAREAIQPNQVILHSDNGGWTATIMLAGGEESKAA